jgi:hypothetical protein
MSLSKVRVLMQDLHERTECIYIYYGICCPDKDEILIRWTDRESLEKAIKKAGGDEQRAMEKIYVSGGIGYTDC